MDNINEQFDGDSLKHKGDVLRARDIIPGSPKCDEGRLVTPPSYDKMTGKEASSQRAGQNENRPPGELKTQPTTGQPKSEIPRFDLAEDIMAEHRRITAIRRKAPGQIDEDQKQKREAELAGYTTKEPSPTLSEQGQIIADIVARDIEKLYRCGTRIGRKQELQGQG